MPKVRPATKPVAILCSDLHWSHLPPIARAGRGVDWYEVMGDYMDQLKQLADELDVPVICAGDIFNHWDEPASLINLCLERMPHLFAVPGQHDLPHHCYDDKWRSAYHTLCEAGKITNLTPNVYRRITGSVVVYGLPWQYGLDMPEEIELFEGDILVLVRHKYIWMNTATKYEGAPKESRAIEQIDDLRNFDVAVFGDNHKGFQTKVGKCRVLNCGGFMRRNIDEIDYKPSVGILYSDKTIETHDLFTESDVFIEAELSGLLKDSNSKALQDFLKAASGIEAGTEDFKTNVRRYLQTSGVSHSIKRILSDIVGL